METERTQHVASETARPAKQIRLGPGRRREAGAAITAALGFTILSSSIAGCAVGARLDDVNGADAAGTAVRGGGSGKSGASESDASTPSARGGTNGRGAGGTAATNAGGAPSAGRTGATDTGGGPSAGGTGGADAGGAPSAGGSATNAGGVTGGAGGGTSGSGGATNLPGPCTPDPCSGHGFCSVVSGAASCACDEGFDAPSCATKNAIYGRRVKVVQDLADPDVIQLSSGKYLLSGTGPAGHDFDFYESQDLASWNPKTTYDPSAADPSYDYCDAWSPELVESGGKLSLYFSAYRGPNGGTTCPPPAGSEHTTFRADSADGTANFGAPALLFQGQGGAESRTQSGCPAGGCGLAIRIDPAVYDGRLYYVFFDKGNDIGSVSMTNPTDFLLHAGPTGWTLPSYEEGINESPEVFSRNGHFYLFFSAAWWDSQYATFYVTANTEAELTRALPVHRLTTPVRRGNGTLAETHGSNSIVTRLGEAFNFFGVGVFEVGGHLIRRDTYRQRLVWNGDGTAVSQNQVQVSWNSLGGGNNYSLDLVLRDGTVVGPCVAVGRIGQNTSTAFTGVCPDASDRLVHKSEVQTFRLYASPNSVFAKVGETPYDGFSDTVNIVATPP